MTNLLFDKKLKNIIPEENIFRDEPMYKHTTFRVGGAVDVYAIPSNEKELTGIIDLCLEENVEFYVIGNGSNLLVSDKGFPGVCIEIGSNMKELSLKDGIIYAEAGALLSRVAAFAMKNSLTGFEFASGIPGTIGGAANMNAGAYGREMKDVIKRVHAYNANAKKLITIERENLEFGYRKSVIKSQKLIVTGVELELETGSYDEIKAKMDGFTKSRREKQPLEYPSAGSTFKRPTGFFAGKLIQDSGLMGYSVGGAGVSEKHAGFVINKNNATATDVYRLIREIQEKVYADSGVRLETEVIMLGEF